MQRIFIYISSWLFIALFAISGKPDCGPPQDKAIQQLRAILDYEGDMRIKKLDSIYNKSLNIPNDSVNRFFLYKLGRSYGYCGDNQKYIKTSAMCYNMAYRARDTLMMAESLHDIGLAYHLETKIDSAYYYYMRAGKLYSENGYRFNYAQVLQQAGALECTGGMQQKAEKHMIRAIQIFDSLNRPRQVLDTYLLITVVLHRMKNYGAALSYHHKIDRLLNTSEDLVPDKEELKNMLAANYNNLGYLCYLTKNYPLAIKNYNKALSIHNSDKSFVALLFMNRAEAKIKNKPRYAWADIESDLKRAYQNIRQKKAPLILLEYKASYGGYYLERGDTATAIYYLKQAENDARQIKSNDDLLDLLPLLSVIDKHKRREYTREYFKINDSITTFERSLSEKFSRIAYETETVQRQNRKLSRNTNYTLAVCIIVFLFGTVSFIIFRLRVSNKKLEFASQQEDANEKTYSLLMHQETVTEGARMQERNRLAMELHDGVMNRVFTTRFNLEQLPTTNDAKKQQVIHELHETQSELRQLSHELKHSFVSASGGFVAALKNYIHKEQQSTRLTFDFYADKFINWATVTPENQVVIFRMIQEACAGAKKRSEKKQWGNKHYDVKIHIAIMTQGTAVKLRIWDDGKGFLPNNKKPGIGIRNVVGRVTARSGTISFKTAVDNGTILDILL